MKTKIAIISIALLLTACATPAAPTQDLVSIQDTAVALAWTSYAITQTAAAPTATFTPLPPTNTPIPTATNTPEPQPIVLTGNGDSVVDVNKWPSVALMKATYTGGSNFMVSNYGAAGNQIDLLVNTIGSYTGFQIIDFYDDDQTTRFEVTASGPWEIQILPISAIRHATAPGVVQGYGDDVVILDGGVTDLFKADASQATSNFIVYGLADSYYLLFNEIAPYSGTKVSEGDTMLIQVKATGSWLIEVTTK
jgi:hypothetical protein